MIWATVVPELMSITVFVLTIVALQAGRSPGYLPNYAILSLNTTGLKKSFQSNTTYALPVHDVYNLYMTTYCAGQYQNSFSSQLVNVTCSHTSSYCTSSVLFYHIFFLPAQKLNYCFLAAKFFPGALLSNDLSEGHSNATLASLSFPSQIQDSFNETYNLQLNVAFIFYILALVWTGIVILLGLASFWVGALGAFTVLFTSVYQAQHSHLSNLLD